MIENEPVEPDADDAGRRVRADDDDFDDII